MKKSILLGMIFIVTTAMANPLVSYRAWQFHEMDTEYVKSVMQMAPQYDINTVVFSHGMIGEVYQLYDGTDRGTQLQALAREAHQLGLRVWIWVHELDHVPEKFVQNGVVQMDQEGFWAWLSQRYENLFTDYPEFDGLILTFHETQYPVFRDSRVQSQLSKPDRFARMIGTIEEVCAKYEKEFIVRTFLYEPIELQWVKEGLLKSSSRVMVQSKCVPHDWDPYYPHNPLIGAFPNNKQIIEFDCSSEYTGRNRVPYTSPEYFEYRWRYGLQQPNVVGYNARLDHAGYDAVFTPNEINLYTLYRLTRDKEITANDIWKEWTQKHYGPSASILMEKALEPTFHVVNKSFFPLEFWITNHTRLPDFGYAEGHITSRTMAKWWPDKPYYKELEQQLLHPDPEILERIIAEKDTAIALAQEALQYLDVARPFLSDGQYTDLYNRLELLHRTALVWKWHSVAFFGYKVLAEGHDVPGLKSRVSNAIDALYMQAQLSELNPWIGDLPPAAPQEIREVADELKLRLDMPDAVWKTVRQEFGRSLLEDVEWVQRNGREVYKITAESDGDTEIDLYISKDGTLIEKNID